MTSQLGPIFVRGLSRSGGTLMCTVLDAHPDISMSYELYPNLLEVEEAVDLQVLAKKYRKCWMKGDVARVSPTRNFATFVIRCERSGLSASDFASLLEQLHDEGRTVGNQEGNYRLMELCAVEKMRRQGKSRWGMKCNNAYDAYLQRWPGAYFLGMLRDGRDVLASQLNTGAFNKTPAEVANGWSSTQRQFAQLVDRPDVNARVVRYERLTQEPEAEIRDICTFLDIPFNDAMLRHSESELTIFKAKHLSRDRVVRKIDTTMIGRWKRDLSPEQLEEFLQSAGDDLKRYGYL